MSVRTQPWWARSRRRAGDLKRRGADVLGRRLLTVADPYRPHLVRMEAPTAAANEPRWGHGAPRHALIGSVLDAHRGRFADGLTAIAPYIDELHRIPVHAPAGELHWANDWLPGLDMALLYSVLRTAAPRRYLEVGSGNSTMLARRAVTDGDLDTEIVSIDPVPRVDIDRFCDRVVRSPLESVDPAVFDELRAGDVVFVDASHRVFMNSDMAVFYLEILPRLPAGVTVGIHDILWPADYLPEWRDYWFSEQYLLGAYLLAGPAWLDIRMAAHYVSGEPDLAALVDPLWAAPGFDAVDRRGFSFWWSLTDGDRPGGRG